MTASVPVALNRRNIDDLSRLELIQRVTLAEQRLALVNAGAAGEPPPCPKVAKLYSRPAADYADGDEKKKQRPAKRRRHAPQPPLEYARYAHRKVALKIAYFGADLDGFATQGNTDNTVECHLFDALSTARLVPHRPLPLLTDDAVKSTLAWDCDYSRCGRTDKGVSALCQVVALNVRSNAPAGHPHVHQPSTSENTTANQEPITMMTEQEAAFYDQHDEIPYCTTLNRLLPPGIRVLAWVGCSDSFSARFDCDTRTYKYFFPRRPSMEQNMGLKRFYAESAGDGLDIDAMRRACGHLVGQHYFRHFAKYDHTKPVNYERTILRATIESINGSEDCEMTNSNNNIKHGPVTEMLGRMAAEEEWFCLTVEGSAFLWRQMRCLMGFLFQVGAGRYKPDSLIELLRHPDSYGPDEHRPERPGYIVASPIPLILWECKYTPENLGGGMNDVCSADPFVPDVQNLVYTEKRVMGLWQEHMTKAIVTYSLFGQLLRDAHIHTPVTLRPPMATADSCADASKFEAQRREWQVRFGQQTSVSWAEARQFFAEYGTYCTVTPRPNATLPAAMKEQRSADSSKNSLKHLCADSAS